MKVSIGISFCLAALLSTLTVHDSYSGNRMKFTGVKLANRPTELFQEIRVPVKNARFAFLILPLTNGVHTSSGKSWKLEAEKNISGKSWKVLEMEHAETFFNFQTFLFFFSFSVASPPCFIRSFIMDIAPSSHLTCVLLHKRWQNCEHSIFIICQDGTFH